MVWDIRVNEGIRLSYDIKKWIGGGGFGQVFKVIRNNTIQTNEPRSALDEHLHMSAVKGGPYIAAIHDEVEWNPQTKTLSLFMDYHKGKDLDRLVHVVRAAGERFTEIQVLDIACQIAMALEHCHARNMLHRDIKPMNILLRQPWNPMVDPTVPELSVSDFGLASQNHTIGTVVTAQRGTPGYEAPEIRARGFNAQFSQKSDIYAFGCILYRLCTLEQPDGAAGLKPFDISRDYSVEMLSLISSMLSYERADRPTATEVKHLLLDLIRRHMDPKARPLRCRKCTQLFSSKEELQVHLRDTGHRVKQLLFKEEPHSAEPEEQRELWNDGTTDHRIVDRVAVPLVDRITRPLEDRFDDAPEDAPCAACMRHFHSKDKLYNRIYCADHVRNPQFVLRKFAQYDVPIPAYIKKRGWDKVDGEDDWNIAGASRRKI